MGYQAGYSAQGANSIAIGTNAGYTAQATNSIVLNATGNILSANTANTLIVAPIRTVVNGSLPTGFFNMAYNPTTKEIIYWS